MKKLAEGQRQMKNLSTKLLAFSVGVAMVTARSKHGAYTQDQLS